jgi:hypothetical protein
LGHSGQYEEEEEKKRKRRRNAILKYPIDACIGAGATSPIQMRRDVELKEGELSWE